MASLIPMLFSSGAGTAGAAAGAGTAAAAPTAATLGAAAAPVAAYGVGTAAPAVAAATPALGAAAAPSLGASLGAAAATPAFGNNLGISYGQLNQLAQSQGNARDFAPFANSMYQQRQPQFGQMQGLPPEQKQPDTLDNMLNFFRNIGSM